MSTAILKGSVPHAPPPWIGGKESCHTALHHAVSSLIEAKKVFLCSGFKGKVLERAQHHIEAPQYSGGMLCTSWGEIPMWKQSGLDHCLEAVSLNYWDLAEVFTNTTIS